jgi:hypothetical protein
MNWEGTLAVDVRGLISPNPLLLLRGLMIEQLEIKSSVFNSPKPESAELVRVRFTMYGRMLEVHAPSEVS